MARVTVEDCVDKISNRFELVLLSAQRARAIASGVPILVDRDNDKNPVVALREVADEKLTHEELRETAVRNLQRHVEIDEPTDDAFSMANAGAELQSSASGEGVRFEDETEIEDEDAEEADAGVEE